MSYQFCFFFSFLQGTVFPYLKVRGNWAGNRCLNVDNKNEGHWVENENWHLNCPLWSLNDLLRLRALCCFHKRKPNIYWGLLKCQDEQSFSEQQTFFYGFTTLVIMLILGRVSRNLEYSMTTMNAVFSHTHVLDSKLQIQNYIKTLALWEMVLDYT